MYDAVFVLVEAFNKILKKKPDTFRTNFRRGQIFNNGSRGLDCNTSQGWVTPWEHGDKISRHLRKVCFILMLLLLLLLLLLPKSPPPPLLLLLLLLLLRERQHRRIEIL